MSCVFLRGETDFLISFVRVPVDDIPGAMLSSQAPMYTVQACSNFRVAFKYIPEPQK